jgi:hypothetical protein
MQGKTPPREFEETMLLFNVSLLTLSDALPFYKFMGSPRREPWTILLCLSFRYIYPFGIEVIKREQFIQSFGSSCWARGCRAAHWLNMFKHLCKLAKPSCHIDRTSHRRITGPPAKRKLRRQGRAGGRPDPGHRWSSVFLHRIGPRENDL